MRKLIYLTLAAWILCAANHARAVSWFWNGAGNTGLWADPANWDMGTVPPPDPGSTGVDVFLEVGNGTAITITNSEVETPGIQTAVTRPPFNTIFGPDFGQTLNLYGSLTYDWVIAPVQNDPTPGVRSTINMFGNSVLKCDGGAAVALGDEWWYFAAPYVTMNLFDNSFVNLTNGTGLWVGGHLNLYDNAVLSLGAGGYLNMDVRGSINEGTRAIVIGGGTLSLPTGWTNAGALGENSGTVYDWIQRGILRPFGKAFDTNSLVITDDGINTRVTTIPRGGALQRVYFLPLVKTSVQTGTFQQAQLVGDYPSVGGVLLSSSEPGLNPALIGTPVYSSSAPGVATVDARGIVTAVSPGTATISATLGVFTSTNTLTLTVSPITATLAHRYSFNESSGSTAADSVGGAAWNGTLQGTASFNGSGQVVLDGNTNGQNYVLLPPGLVSNLDQITVELWATVGVTTTNNFENLFAFGNSDTDPLDPAFGLGGNLVSFSPHTAGATSSLNFGQGLPGSEGERDAVLAGVLDGATDLQITAVYNPYAGTQSLYTNGVLAATVTMFNNMIDPAACLGPAYTGRSILAYQLADNPINYVGKSLYNADPGFLGSVDELRIYSGARTASQIAAENALGPNQLLGAATSVSLTATLSGGNIILSWPTTSALVTVLSSPTLGTGAVWTPMNSPLTVVAGKYQMTVPMSGNARYFRLSL